MEAFAPGGRPSQSCDCLGIGETRSIDMRPMDEFPNQYSVLNKTIYERDAQTAVSPKLRTDVQTGDERGRKKIWN
jgi:hypothetical protein